MSSPGQEYSNDDLMQALRAADAAGDHDGATRLAQMLSSRMGGASPQETSVAGMQDPNPISRYAKMVGGAALEGFGQLVGLPGTIINAVNKGTTAAGNFLTGSNVAPPPTFLPTGANIVGGLQDLGLVNRPDAVPLTTGERLLTGAVSGGAAAGPFGLPATGIGALSGMASEGAHELWPNSTLAPVAAGMLTGFGVGGVANTVDNVLTGQALDRAVASANAAHTAAQLTRENIPTDAAGVANTIAPTQTLQEAGANLQAAARKWAQGDRANNVPSIMQQKMDVAWAPVAQLVGNDAPVTLTNFEKAIKDATTSAGKLEPVGKIFRPQLPDRAGSAMDAVKEFLDMSASGEPFTWDEVSRLRTMIGDARGNPKTVENIGKENLSNMYRALTADMRGAAQAKGGDALKAFDAANTESSRLFGIAKNQIQPLLDKNPEDAAASLVSAAKKGGTNLQILRTEIPDAVDSLAAAHIRNAGEDWRNLSKEGKLALTGNQSIVDQMDDIMKQGSEKTVLTAKQALDNAREAVKVHSAPRYNPMEGVLGSGIGYDLGVLGLNALGFQGHDILGGAAGSLLGAGASRIGAPILRAAVQNPRYPLIGGIGGMGPANQLTATQVSQ